MSPSDLEGKTYGPMGWRIDPAAVADYVRITGDDPERWAGHAPPGFAAAALFVVAPELLDELFGRSVIHGEQSFRWHRNLSVGARLEVSGTVSRVRERGGVHFVTFDMRVTDESDPVLDGKSLFLVSGESPPAIQAGLEHSEPPHSYDGGPMDGEVSASRADLVRHAAATRDWNPVHWDHEAGVAAGFPGVVVHGLLQAGWAMRAASAGTESNRPFSSGRFRFRNPMLPAHPANVTVERSGRTVEISIADQDLEYLSATVELVDE